MTRRALVRHAGAPALLLLLLCCPRRGPVAWGASLTGAKAGHPGVCPNQLNSNLWVDAQSTCERECLVDQDCAGMEKCCTNVCGLKSCVAARFSESPPGKPDHQKAGGSLGNTGASWGSISCHSFMCSQQGSTCDIWEGQPICKCRDRCEKEPSFTCASDGLTYFNRCYMDAEACIRGVTLTVVTCRYHLSWPHTSPLPLDTTTNPTPTTFHEDPFPPALYHNPTHQSVYLGGTVSFHCDVVGSPKPDITWEKQTDRRESLIMRPDQMYGNQVVTNIGQLVIYNAQPGDSGIYTCTARNVVGILRADFPLSVIRRTEEEESFEDSLAGDMRRPFSPGDCMAEVDRRVCGEQHVDWYYDSKRAGCLTFTFGGCNGSRNHFETYEECHATCHRNGMNICNLPAVQGPCKSWEARWAYNSLMKQCQAFVYGGCQGNGNNFRSQEECEDNCPLPKGRPCKPCRPKAKMVPSLCRSDFAIVGRVTEVIEDQDTGIARFRLEEILRDEKMGLAFFNTRHLEVTLAKVDWRCPCPNVTVEESPLIVMGDVQDGMAILQPDSYVRPVNDKRLKKIHEVLEKKTCELLQRFQD
ncbi:WAP, Kazal, immunoglobulin, Kunitz and NTR domain-containing protein [Erpetoichthys calabaricus]|uniref:WAP, Kazal, immunoglobulin, Kunitz and NTR domain-containing protein n=1 Tax=Erpetoichthys calabaricus TaxID=27687 RepID=UPI002233F1B1|nr:WAP, Kazal, immunoglobulin, Kunitz and NTR domain-containing protein [Erpetoichthys calabaricus]